MTLNKRLLLLALPLALLAGQATARTDAWGAFPPHPMAQPQTPAPAVLVREGLSKLNDFMSSGAARQEGAVNLFLAQEIAPYFDLAYMSRWAAGPLYHRLNDAQRGALALGLGKLFFQNMASHLAGYQGGRIHYLPSHAPGGRETTVRVEVMGYQRMPVRIDFRMYRGDDGWKVFDIRANGQSAVVHYRNVLAGMARQMGIPGMLQHLASL